MEKKNEELKLRTAPEAAAGTDFAVIDFEDRTSAAVAFEVRLDADFVQGFFC